MSVTRAQPRTRPSGHWSIDFARGGLLRGDYASPSCRFPEEGRVHAGGGARGGRPGWGERGHDWRTRPGRAGQPRRPRYRPRGPRVRGLGSQPPRLVAIPLLSSIAISTGSVTSILLSIQILSFLRRFVSASFSNDSSIGDVFFFPSWTSRDAVLFERRDESFRRRH